MGDLLVYCIKSNVYSKIPLETNGTLKNLFKSKFYKQANSQSSKNANKKYTLARQDVT